MARRNQVKNFERVYSFISSPSSLLADFLFWQVIVISFYLASREREKFDPILSNGLYLGVVAISTLFLTVHLFYIRTDKKFDKQDKVVQEMYLSKIRDIEKTTNESDKEVISKVLQILQKSDT